MVDSASDKPERSVADKERSRQLSRPVSGKEAARTVGGGNRQRGQGQGGRGQGQGGRGQGQGGQGGRNQGQRAQAGRSSAQRPAGRPGARRPPTRRPARAGRPRSGLFVWGAVGLVIVIVAVIVAVSQTSSSTTKGLHYKPKPVPATVLHDITHVPASAFDAVGIGPAGINVPVVESSLKPLTTHGKPEVFGLFGEFCPFCAAERWPIIVALSRFGTFTGLKTMQSSPIDSFPKTQTFEFKTATYTSPYVAAKLVEFLGQDRPTGTQPTISTVTKAEEALIKKYDTTTSDTTRSGSIPFSDWGNKVFFPGATYSPQPLQGLSRATIAAGLKDPGNIVTQIILGIANYMSAAVCSMDGGKPGAVCSSSGVQTAAKALKIKV